MNIVSDPKLTDPKPADPKPAHPRLTDSRLTDLRLAGEGTVLSPEANQAAALATATGVLTVDLDALVANWRRLEKAAVPAECAGVIKADAYGCGIEPVARALASAGCKTFFVATIEEARAARGRLGLGDAGRGGRPAALGRLLGRDEVDVDGLVEHQVGGLAQ